METALNAGAAEVRDLVSIEETLAAMWRSENTDDGAVTRAALWNVVAHTASVDAHTDAMATLAKVAASVPQRTIVVRSEPESAPDLTSWVSANCHLVGGKKQVCSEAVALVAGGDRIHRIAPLIKALLLPDMPVAFWWTGDLPNELEQYVETMLEPADRLIFDSRYFDRVEDFELVQRAARRTATMPADLNWVRLEEWRLATAAIFDGASAQARLHRIRKVRITAVGGSNAFGGSAEAMLYVAWLRAQLGMPIEYDITLEAREQRRGSLLSLTILFDEGLPVALSRDEEKQVIMLSADGSADACDHVTRMDSRSIDDLIVRQLNRTNADPVFLKALPIVIDIARRYSE